MIAKIKKKLLCVFRGHRYLICKNTENDIIPMSNGVVTIKTHKCKCGKIKKETTFK